jgi:Ca2+/H+ antiporter
MMRCWGFVIAWVVVIVFWGLVITTMGVKALIGFLVGVLTVVAVSLAVGLAAAKISDRGGEWDND